MKYRNLPQTLPQLFPLADSMYDGIIVAGAAVGLVHVKAPAFKTALENAHNNEAAYQTARANRIAKTEAQTLADTAAFEFIRTTKGVLKNYLGHEWNTAWAQAGFVDDSLGIPLTQDGRMRLVGTLKTYLDDHADQEVPSLKVTAAEANTRRLACAEARSAVLLADTQLGQQRDVRNEFIEELRVKMRELINELTTILPPDDPRWNRFGLNEPAARHVPSIPGKPTAIMDLPGGGHLTLEWAASSRVERYRVWMKKPSDADFAAMATTYDNDAVLADLPTGVALTFRITAMNGAGESPPSPEIMVTPA